MRRLTLVAALAALSVLSVWSLARAVRERLLDAEPARTESVSTGQAAAQRGISPTGSRSVERVLEDAEIVYGPLALGFDTSAFLAGADPELGARSTSFRGRAHSLADVIEIVAREHSLSPKLLIALLLAGDAGRGDAGGDPASSLEQAAAWLGDGYYGYKYRGERSITFADGTHRSLTGEVNAAHFAVVRYLALGSDPEAWMSRVSGFSDTYETLFGPPPPDAVPSIGAAVAQPALLLPWPAGETWHFTGGPHGGWGIATAWSAVDFAPPTQVGCGAAPEWSVAAAPGVVEHAADGLVLLDLDGDGFFGTGWVLAYLHMAARDRAAVGARLAAGDRIGHPSCEGGRSTGAHLHFARRFNGEWVPVAGGPAALDLSGWRFTQGEREYDGTMTRPGDATLTAVASGRRGQTTVVSDNGPAQWGALAESWSALAAPVAQATRSLSATVEPVVHTDPAVPPASEPGRMVAEPEPAGVDDPRGDAGGTIEVKLALEGRASHDTPFIIGLSRPGGGTAVVMGRTDAGGRSGPIALPPLASDRYTVTVRAPGYLPAEVFGVDYGPGPSRLALDLSGGGITPLRGGDLTQDDAVDAADIRAWFGMWLRESPEADLDGSGRAGLGDLARVLRNREQGASAGGGAGG